MWLKLNRYNIANGELTEVCSLSPASMGVMVEMPVIQEAITKDLGAKEITLVVIASVHPYFAHRPIPQDLVACFAASKVDGERADHDWAYVVTFE